MPTINVYTKTQSDDLRFHGIDDVDASFGGTPASGGDLVIRWSTGDTSNHTAVIGLGDTDQQLHITDKAAVATDWGRAAGTHPELAIHSNTTPITDYLAIGLHDGSLAWLGNMVGGATLKIGFDLLEALILEETASAVNEITIKNAATGNKPIIQASGEQDTGIIFQNEGDEELVILASVATPVNELTIGNAATGNNPTIDATGEADTGITFRNDQSEEILILDAIASAVNELTIKNAATGNKPILAATGEADTGLEFHNDQAEEMLILAAVATAINEVTITNAASGSGPTISVTGGGTNEPLNLTPLGTGDVELTKGHVTMADGGTVTQATNKSTGVTLNTESGQVTMNNASLADDTTVEFTVTNDKVGALDVVHATLASVNTAGAYSLQVDAQGAGSFVLSLRNHSGGSLGEAIVINFVVLGGASS